VTAPHQISEGVAQRQNHLRIDARDLCHQFVQWIVAEAQAGSGEDAAGDLPEVDWAAVWSAGDGATSDELALGRIVRAASEAAHGVAADRQVPEVPEKPDGFKGATPSATALLTRSPEIEHDLEALADSSAVQVESVPAPAQPQVVPSEVVTAEPVADPVTEPVVITAGAVDSATIAPPEPSTETLPEAPTTEQVEAVRTVTVVLPPPIEESFGSDELAEDASSTRPRGSTHSAWYHVFTWMRNVGIIILLFVVWQLWGTDIAQRHSQSQLQNQFEAAVRAHHVPAIAGNGKGLIPATTVFAPPADGSAVARLQIPAIGVNQYMVEGTTSDDLSKGPGHYVGTALPGQAGNVAIAGHRTTHGAPFNGLGHLTPGNRIILTTTWGEKLTYVASGTPQVVSPGDVGVLNYFGDNRITLTTCNPEFSSSQRLVVVGKLRQPPGAHVALPARVTYHVANAGTASWNWSLLPLVGIEICLLLLLALSYNLMDGWFSSSRKWLLLVPLWAAGLYLLFGTMTSFLPSSI
jgi:sortase A